MDSRRRSSTSTENDERIGGKYEELARLYRGMIHSGNAAGCSTSTLLLSRLDLPWIYILAARLALPSILKPQGFSFPS